MSKKRRHRKSTKRSSRRTTTLGRRAVGPPSASEPSALKSVTTPLATAQLEVEWFGGEAAMPPAHADEGVGDLAELYFEPASDPFRGWEAEPERIAGVFSAHALGRRAKLAKYVRGVVAMAAALCVAAIVKGALVRGSEFHATPVTSRSTVDASGRR